MTVLRNNTKIELRLWCITKQGN